MEPEKCEHCGSSEIEILVRTKIRHRVLLVCRKCQHTFTAREDDTTPEPGASDGEESSS